MSRTRGGFSHARVRRITITLPDELAAALQREARRRALPASTIVRDALTAYLWPGNTDDQRALPFAALGRSGHADTARAMDDLLEHEWAADAGAPGPPASRMRDRSAQAGER